MVLAKDRIAMQLFFVILEYLDKVDNNNITEQLRCLNGVGVFRQYPLTYATGAGE
jgi:hypothetical protein